jgi:DMSO/TMAO reductase YedYZ molybdopterin-dependent catalytic subunit
MSQNKKDNERRKFLRQSLLGSISMAIGMPVVFGKNLTEDILPIVLNESLLNGIPGKSELLVILNDRPVNAETPAHLLDDDLTPNDLFFVRNNGLPPVNVDPENWTIEVSGESVKSKKTFKLSELKSKYENLSLDIVIECGGNGRSEFNPPAKGNQWTTGGMGCARWTGIRLRDLLNEVGLKSDAVYVAYYGADTHLSGDPRKHSISRGVPIEKAMAEDSLLAWSMNGKDIPLMNGHPVRLVFGGYPASCSGKWVNKIVVRNKVHDGAKMGGQSYRVPCEPVAPGTKVADDEMCIIEEMPVKSLITYPKTGATIQLDQKLPIRGHAWTSAPSIQKVEYSIDFGVNWQECTLKEANNRFAWQNFNAEISFPKAGYYEVWGRATDSNGDRQPIILPGWNPKGYLNNACHRIAVKVTAS